MTVPVMHTYSLAPCAFLATSCRAGVGTLFAPWVTVMGGEENGEEVETEEEGEE